MKILKNEISGVVLTGGRGRRVGEQDKGLLLFDGRKIIEKQIDWLDKQVAQVYISANRNIECYRAYGKAVITDGNLNFSGPLTGISRVLEYCTTNWLFVQPVDMPLLPDDTIERLILAAKGDRPAYFLKSTQREHYLSMLISKSVLTDLQKYLNSGNSRVRDFLYEVKAESINPGITEQEFANYNKIGDYQA